MLYWQGKRKKIETPNTSVAKETLDKSSEVNRLLGLFMVAFLFYLLVTVSSISDLQLLVLDKGIELPLIGISLPILSFAWVALVIIIGIHLNTLLNLLEHSTKLNSWMSALLIIDIVNLLLDFKQ